LLVAAFRSCRALAWLRLKAALLVFMLRLLALMFSRLRAPLLVAAVRLPQQVISLKVSLAFEVRRSISAARSRGTLRVTSRISRGRPSQKNSCQVRGSSSRVSERRPSERVKA